jgi:hypothetical protein
MKRARHITLMLGLLAPLLAQAEPPQLPAQSQPSFIEVAANAWTLDWTGLSGRTYFIQTSFDLDTWIYQPAMAFGDGTWSTPIGSSSSKFFARLVYTDDSSVGSLHEAKAADFDGDGVSNFAEVMVLWTNPLNPNSNGTGANDYFEDQDADGIPDGWEATAIVNQPTNSGITGLQHVSLSNITQVANEAEMEPPAGTLPQQISISVSVPSSAPLTLRAESVWSVQPADLTFSKGFFAPDNTAIPFPDWHFNQPNALVLVKNNLTSITVSATSMSEEPVKLKILRDPADITDVGTGPLTLLPVNATDTATVSLDDRGSFYILGWIDSNENNIPDTAEPRYVCPLILVDVDVKSIESKTGEPIFSYLPPQGFEPGYRIVQFGENDSDFAGDEDLEMGDVQNMNEEMYEWGKAGVSLNASVLFIGGKDGLRGIDRVMGGWSNNIMAFNSPATYRKDGVQEAKTLAIGFASNVADASGWDEMANVPMYNPADAAPDLFEEPILDRFEFNAAINGMNAVCLRTGSFRRLEPLNEIGRRARITVWDSPRDSYPESHPNHVGFELTGFQTSTAFSAFLTFWTSPRPLNDIDGESINSRGMAGERTYQTAFEVKWDTVGIVENLGPNAVAGGSISVSGENEFSPAKEPNTVNHETRPPTSGSTIHYDAR